MARAANPSGPRPGLVLAIDAQLDRLSAIVFDPSSSRASSPGPTPSIGQPLHTQTVWQQTVYFDDFPEFQTKKGIYQPHEFDEDRPRDFALTPVGVIVRALDVLLHDLSCAEASHAGQGRSRGTALTSRIGTVGVSGTTDVPILLSHTATALLATLRADEPLSAQLGCPSFFATPFVPNAKDWTLDSESMTIKHALLEFDRLFAQETSAASGLVANLDDSSELPPQRAPAPRRTHDLVRLRFAAALLRLRLAADAQDAVESAAFHQSCWHRTGHITTMAGLITMLLTGCIPSWSPDEAALSALYDTQASRWDVAMTSVVGACPSTQLGPILGPVRDPEQCSIDSLSRWCARRFDFPRDCKVAPQLSSYTAIATACTLEPKDGIVQLGLDDFLIVALDTYPEASAATVIPFAAAVGSVTAPSAFLALSLYEDAGTARKIIRSAYSNDRWSVMNRLVNAVPVGGSIGLDNKLFTRVVSRCGIQDIRRFERGCRVTEFSDLRANARCLLEGQAMSIRADLVQLRPDLRLHGTPAKATAGPTHAAIANGAPRQRAPRLFAFGKPAANKTLISILSAALGSPLQVPAELLALNGDEDEDAGGRNAQPLRAAHGTAGDGLLHDSRPCRQLLGTALHALARRVRFEPASGPSEALHAPGVAAVLHYLNAGDDGSSSTASLEEDVAPATWLDCQQVAFTELTGIYIALAEEHARLDLVGDVSSAAVG